MINSVPLQSYDSQFNSLSNSMLTPLKAPEVQCLNLSMGKKSSGYSVSKQSIRPKPSTDRTHVLNESFKEFTDQIHECCRMKEMHSKADLLQKRKQYAESIREKNRGSTAKQQKSKNQKHLHNQTMNLSLSFTPPKDIPNLKHKESIGEFLEIEKEYYSTKKYQHQENLSNSKVFAESNMNLRNSMILMENDNMSCSKFSKMAHNNTAMDLGLSIREGVHSQRRNANNKENKPHGHQQPGSGRKNTAQKYSSYVEIFNQKNSMNTLIQTQKSKGTGNTTSRQMSSLRKEKSALKSMATPELFNENYTGQFSVQLDTFVNGFVVEGFNEDESEEISRIKESKNESKVFEKIKTENEEVQVQELYVTENVQLSISPKHSLQIFSQTVNEVVDYSVEFQAIRKQEQKELMMLAKQNATFKRELASFRKENSTLKKQLQTSKNYVAELELKAKKLLEEQSQFIVNQEKFLQGYAEKVTQEPQKPATYVPLSSNNFGDNLEQILISTEQELFSLKSSNKALELKVYMLEKKLSHEEELSKKRLALEVHNWRDKYNKLRNQNIKLKNSLHPFNSDLSFSMEMSRDE